MEISRLLAYLGYEMGTPVVGRTEAINSAAMQRLVEPHKKTGTPKAQAEAAAKPEAEAAKPEPEPEPAKPEGEQKP